MSFQINQKDVNKFQLVSTSTYLFNVTNTLGFAHNVLLVLHSGFPLGPENLEKWEGIFQSGNFEQTGKVRENHTQYWKTEGISDK